MRSSGLIPAVATLVALLGACAQEASPPEVTLGPADGFELAPTDLERVAVGEPAPLFSLESYFGDIVSLEDFRGESNVVLVFYRGHW